MEDVTLLYFAWVRQKTGKSEEHIDLPPDIATVRQLAEHLRTRHPEAFADLARLRAAVNREHVAFDAPVSDGDEVAFFPPVTGG
jgi:molybdopterin synthase sulfur carrier subunit